ncbi:hypothetical protein BDU57DRAFT_542801 [Ampelomyces quisqualis]|uniref:Extracellular membrane protein CFEM domain-containing protein n=1 Tax=Ampelomyces quisqualis TaxID=50730 RepID=A0A6A5Q7C1_AMPQU|nr:hypothetical protein BDU57DRAFT_542801 [Ampelomyces quisqualis]
MRRAIALLFMVAQFFVLTTAHRDWLVKGLPQCWQDCLKATEDGCSSSSCICKTSADSTSYLPGAISCTVSKCNADEVALDMFLGPLDMLCSGIHCPIPDEVIKAAYANERPQSIRTTSTTTSSRKPEHSTSKTTENGPELTSTIRSTLTRTSADSSGHTLQIMVPIVVGPSGVSTGFVSTSTLTGRSTSSIIEPSLPDLSLMPSSTSAAAPQETGGSAGGSGSPFDAPAAATQWTVPAPLLGMVALAMLYMRL